jgi:hypothetical protein
MALVNQYLGNTPPTGLAPINPTLYSLYPNNATSKAFHDVTTGSNIVPCTSPSPNCPTGTTTIGFNAGVGYDQVTGLGSVDGFNLAQAWAASAVKFSLTPSLPAGSTLTVAQGATTTAVNLTVTSSDGFVVTSGTSSQTLLPVSYSCSGLPSEATCLFSPGSPSSSTSISFTIKTTAPTAELRRPFDGGTRIFYAVLLPGLFGIMFTVGSRKRSLRGMRMLGLMVVLGFSTLWLSSCSGSSGSGNSNPGTPKGTTTVTINAVGEASGQPSITASPVLSFQLTVD